MEKKKSDKELDGLTCCVFEWENSLNGKYMTQEEWNSCQKCIADCEEQYRDVSDSDN